MTENKSIEAIAVDIKTLKLMLGCGTPTALTIAENAKARISVPGMKRTLYSVEKIREYLAKNTN